MYSCSEWSTLLARCSCLLFLTKDQRMVQQADLVIIGICVGLAAGILIASLAFFGIRWYKKRARLQQRENERSPSTLPIRRHGLNTSVDFSASLSSSVTNGPIEPIQKPQHSWWNNHTKDRFASVSGILRYSYKYVTWMVQFSSYYIFLKCYSRRLLE